MNFIENDRNGLTQEEYEKQRRINNAKLLGNLEIELAARENNFSLDNCYLQNYSSEEQINANINFYKERYANALKNNDIKLIEECQQVIFYFEEMLKDDKYVKKSVK